MDVVGRLFNHRPVISGEINTLIQGFNAHLKSDEERLQLVCKCATSLSDIVLPTCHKIGSDNIPQIQNKVLTCSEMCKKVLALQDQTAKHEEDTFNSAELDDLAINLKLQRESLLKEFDAAAENLIKEYQEKERCLTLDTAS